MKKQIVLAWILLAVSVGLGVVSYLVLPATVVTQFSVGSSNVTTMPKLLAILIPLAIGVGGAAATIFGKGDGKSMGKRLLIAAVGVVIFVIMLLVNL